MHREPIQAVPTNIITGFLGVGKTTLIKRLLVDKPKEERWAVLVNEFGEIGIDGALMNGSDTSNVFIKEVPGGCMCCTSGLPMQIALNMLLAKARPHRLLIEPTGLGHPAEVLATLNSVHYKEVLNVQTTLTLIDARKVADPRYSEHPIFQEQLQIADLIYASKADLYAPGDSANLDTYLDGLGCLAGRQLLSSDMTNFDLNVLSKPSNFVLTESQKHHHASEQVSTDIDDQMQKKGWAKVTNHGEGFVSYGWLVSPERIFEYQQVLNLLSYLDVERLKAVIITERGIFTFNYADGVLSQQEIDETNDSRLEFIAADQCMADELAMRLEQTLLA